jgi:hypothetical protein
VGKLEDLFDLVTELCTIEQIKGVLESARGNKDVRLSAANKADLLNKNLRDAINAHAIPVEKVYDLLRNAEENGDQHIFYYRVPRSLRDHMAFGNIGSLLALPASLVKSFPALDLVPNGYTIADFRSLAPRNPNDWVLKVYGDETREFFTGRIVPEDGTKHLKEYDVRRYRYVLVMRWNFPDLLELRIPRDASRGRRTTWLDHLWQTVGNAFQQSSLKPWDLSKARQDIIGREEFEGTVFSLRDTQMKMPGQERATFEPYLPGASLFAAQYARQAVQDLFGAQSTCTRLNITWLPGPGTDFEGMIRTIVGADESNEVIFPGHQSASEVDYVTEKLRGFSKNA